MPARRSAFVLLLPPLLAATHLARAQEQEPPGEVTLRVATFNINDVRSCDLENADHPRLKRLAEVIQRIRPNVILLNEIAYDGPGSPGFREGQTPGRNGQRFVDLYLTAPQAEGLSPIRYRAFMAPVNTGIASGFDLDNNARVVNIYPPPGKSLDDGSPAPEPERARDYGGDCWGYGSFPGQYGMCLLVDERLAIQEADVRTFRLFPWDYMHAPLFPMLESGNPWYDDEERKYFRISSKSHWDIPVKFPSGAVIHFLCSHPTPPVFDGPEKRNAKRNRDEIRFWADYISRREYFVDDRNVGGPIDLDASFVILGDLNADPEKGDSLDNPIGNILFGTRGLNSAVTPRSEIEVPDLAATDTAFFKLRVDYVLPSTDLGIAAAGIWREPPTTGSGPFPSDHFPVWMELVVPNPVPVRAPETPPAGPTNP